MIKININGKDYTVNDGITILEAANENDIYIPTLCHHPAVEPYGVCRLCIVDIKKGYYNQTVISCAYPVKNGLIIETDNEKIRNARKIILELLLSAAPNSKTIKQLADKYGIIESRFKSIDRDFDCILCGLCVRVCSSLIKSDSIAFAYRGIKRSPTTPYAKQSDVCIGCNACVNICPIETIKFHDDESNRILDTWNTTVKLKECSSCGKKYSPEPLFELVSKKVDIDKDLLNLCIDCRRKNLINVLSKNS